MLCTALRAEPVLMGLAVENLRPPEAEPPNFWGLRRKLSTRENSQKPGKCLAHMSSSGKGLAFSLSVPGLQGIDEGWSLEGKLLLSFLRMMSQTHHTVPVWDLEGKASSWKEFRGHLVKLGRDMSIL